MYKYKEEKLTQDKITFNLNDIKRELESSVNEENKRVNVDSAKKRAVLQHMDYDNFRQMVLGANIMPVKTADVNDLMALTNIRSVMNANSSISFQDKTSADYKANEGKNNGLNTDINTPENSRDFKKYFDRILKLECERMDVVNIALKYIEDIPKEKYKKVFGLEFSVDDFMKIVAIFQEYCQGVEKLAPQSVRLFVNFLEGLSEQDSFNSSILKWLSKQEKEKLTKFFKEVEDRFSSVEEQENLEAFKELSEKIQKLKTVYKLQ